MAWKQLREFHPHGSGGGAWMCLLSPEGAHGRVVGGSSSSPESADTSPRSRVPAVSCWCTRIIPLPLTEGLLWAPDYS